MIQEFAVEAGPAPPKVNRSLFLAYRTLAISTAVLLLILVFIAMPLQYLAHSPTLMAVTGTMHGFLYLAYLIAAFQVTRKLHIPKWQMALVLLAGTVPFCAFVAERKMTKRLKVAQAQEASRSSVNRIDAPTTTTYTKDSDQGGLRIDSGPSQSQSFKSQSFKDRWFSPRALLLHLEVTAVAVGCGTAGWWQATRALAGNTFSWIYVIEWPIFGLLAVAGWWYLINEDPDVYRARKFGPLAEPDLFAASNPTQVRETPTVTNKAARLATAMAILTGVELVLGMVVLVAVPIQKPLGAMSHLWVIVYLSHTALGAPLAFGSIVLLVLVNKASRLSRLTGWFGAIGIAIAGAGGLLSMAHPMGILGMSLMLLGTLLAALGYLIPSLEKLT